MKIETYSIGKHQATLTVYILEPVSANPERLRPAVIICPGGGYMRVSDREATPVAMQYLAMGCQVMVLDYSVAPNRFPEALGELAACVALVRSHAAEWLVDPERILVSGFSAGGHLACSLGAFWNRPELFAPLGLMSEQVKPDGLILCYPVITAGPGCHSGSFEHLLGEQAQDPAARNAVSLELQVGSHTPKTFLWHTWTDQSVPVINSLRLADALYSAGVSLELHIYPIGGHGLSLATAEVSSPAGEYVEPQCQNWIELVKNWIAYF